MGNGFSTTATTRSAWSTRSSPIGYNADFRSSPIRDLHGI